MTKWRWLPVVVWLAGAGAVTWLTPVGPSDDWQVPAGQWLVGFLADGRTAVTASGDARAEHDSGRGPLRLWDGLTGQPRGRLLDDGDAFVWAETVPGTDWVCVYSEADVGPTRLKPGSTRADGFAVRSYTVYDARTGTAIRTLAGSQHDEWFLPTGRGVLRIVFEGHPNVGGGGPTLRAYDVQSGDLAYTLTGCGWGLLASRAGDRFAALHDSALAVFDAATGRLLTQFASDDDDDVPIEFSPDGSLLLGTSGIVWDITTGRERFRLPAFVSRWPCFSADGRSLVAVVWSGADIALECYDTATGRSRPECHRRLWADAAFDPFRLATSADRRTAILTAAGHSRTALALDRWLASRPDIRAWIDPHGGTTYELIDTDSGRPLERGGGQVIGLTPDGGRTLRLGRAGTRTVFWDRPPLRSARRLAVAVGGWTAAVVLAVGLIAWWRRRR